MRKKIILSAFIVILFICSIFQTASFAADDSIEDEEVENILSSFYMETKDIDEKNFYSSKEEIVLGEKIINGNAFMAAKNVTFNDITINGDVFVVADKVVINSDASLNGNVFICASNIEIAGKISRELYAVANNINFDNTSKIMYEAKMVAEQIKISGEFYRDVRVYATELELSNTTGILGKLDYVAEKEAKVPETAFVKEINFSKKIEKNETKLSLIADKVFNFTRYFILTMVIFFVFMKFMPTMLKKVESNLSVSSFGIGILSIILIPVLSILLLVSSIATTLGFVLIALLVLVLLVSMAVTNISIASVVSKKSEKMKLPISVPLVTAITWILLQIPYAGIVVGFILITTGLGICIRNIFTKANKN